MLACSHKNQVLPADKQSERIRSRASSYKTTPLPCPDASTDEVEVDTIRDRFPDGRVRIERQMKLDANGNFIHHGSFKSGPTKETWLPPEAIKKDKGRCWIRVCQAKESKLFETYPYAKFKFPLQSSVDLNRDR